MATVTKTYLVDDIDGSTDGVETVQFNAEGTNYEIDLSAENAARLREKLARFVDAASTVKAPTPGATRRGARTKAATVASKREHTHDIREWAKQAGLQVSERGRIAKAVQDAYDAR
jgi:hypothetical protein